MKRLGDIVHLSIDRWEMINRVDVRRYCTSTNSLTFSNVGELTSLASFSS